MVLIDDLSRMSRNMIESLRLGELAADTGGRVIGASGGFGSDNPQLALLLLVLHDDFDPSRSDIDVLADFKPEATRGIGFRFFGYGDELGGILGRRGDAGLERGWKTRRHLQARVAFSPGCCFS